MALESSTPLTVLVGKLQREREDFVNPADVSLVEPQETADTPTAQMSLAKFPSDGNTLHMKGLIPFSLFFNCTDVSGITLDSHPAQRTRP